MAKTTPQRFPLLFLGFYLVLVMSMCSEVLSEETCVDIPVTSILDTVEECITKCKDKFGNKASRGEVKRDSSFPVCFCCEDPDLNQESP
ncbi:hypothetical protein MKW92_038129 [Papaver armeniacum]|nr:hypothetical protein MKW92_038129 [Papaver armeniacum]